jgi:hypothetical protein
MPLPMPSDAAEYLSPIRGNLERWEYTPWDNRWYRLNRGVPLAVPLIVFLAITTCALLNQRIRTR